jgi:hypothetical protein
MDKAFRPRTGECIALDLVPISQIVGDDDTDTQLLHAMARDAEAYILSFQWCGTVFDSFFGGGMGGVFAIFLFRIQPSRPDVDNWIWVMVGDTAPAYLPIADCSSVAEAFRMYIWGMTNWVRFARHGTAGAAEEDVPPVDLPLSSESADWLELKIQLLTHLIQPLFEEDSDSPVQ